MAEWTEANLSQILPGATKEILRAAGAAANTVGTTAEAIASGIETAADLLYDITDPARALLKIVIDQLKALITDLMATGIYLYYDANGFPFYQTRTFSFQQIVRYMDIDGQETAARARYERDADAAKHHGDIWPPYEVAVLPLVAATAYGWNGWARRFKDSCYDQGDKQRPDFSEQAQVTCILMVAGTPSFDALPALLKALGIFLGIKPFTDILDHLAITEIAVDAKAGETVIEVKPWGRGKNFVDDDMVWIRPTVSDDGGAFSGDQFVTLRSVNRRYKTFQLYDALKQDYPAGTLVTKTGTNPQVRQASVEPDWISRFYLGRNVDENAVRNAVYDPEEMEYFLPLTVGDLPFMKPVDRAVKNLIGLLEMADGFIALIQELADALKEKAEQLRNLAQLIEDVIELIAQILTLTGLYIIPLSSDTGMEGIFSQMDSIGGPPLPDKSFLVGGAFVAGTVNIGPLADLLGV